MVPPAQHPGQDHNHVRETTRSPPAAHPRPRSGTTPRLPARPAAHTGGPGRQDG